MTDNTTPRWVDYSINLGRSMDLTNRPHLKREFDEKVAAFRKHEKDEVARAAKRQAMEEDLANKARTYFDHTGTTPPASVVETWKLSYIEGEAHLQEADKEARRAAAEEAYDF
jgi:hypothetical protein